MSLPEDSTDIDDLPWSAKHLLWVLEEAGGSLTRNELQERTEMAPRTLDRAVSRLEDVGVVRRDRANDDLRYVHIEINEKS